MTRQLNCGRRAGLLVLLALCGGLLPLAAGQAQTPPAGQAANGEIRVNAFPFGQILSIEAAGRYVVWTALVARAGLQPPPGPTPPGAPPTVTRPAPPAEAADLYAADLGVSPPRIMHLAGQLPPATRVSIAGSRVVWSRYDPVISPFSQVTGHDLATNQVFTVPATGGNQYLPTISGDWVIWSGAPPGGGPGIPEAQAIQAWNLGTGERRILDTYIMEDEPQRAPAPVAAGDLAAYIVRLPPDLRYTLRAYDFATGRARTIAQLGEDQYRYANLRMGGEYVLWETPAAEIDLVNIMQAPLTRDEPPVVSVASGVRAGSLSTAGALAVWQTKDGPVVGWTINTRALPRPLTPEQARPQALTAVSAEWLAWADGRDPTTPAIYALRLGGVAPPTPTPIADPFTALWAQLDEPVAAGLVTRSWTWGPRPEGLLAGDRQEPYAQAPGAQRLVRYYDKGRMEINDPRLSREAPWYVTSGLLVVEMIRGQIAVGDTEREGVSANPLPVAGDPGSPDAPSYATLGRVLPPPESDIPVPPVRTGAPITTWMDGSGALSDRQAPALVRYGEYDHAVGHNVAEVFVSFMKSRGLVNINGSYEEAQLFDPLFTFGYPLMEPVWITIRVGGQDRPVLFQAFERRTLTYTPGNPPAWQVEMGNVGQHYYTWRYGGQ
jgi:hypothetical protein